MQATGQSCGRAWGYTAPQAHPRAGISSCWGPRHIHPSTASMQLHHSKVALQAQQHASTLPAVGLQRGIHHRRLRCVASALARNAPPPPPHTLIPYERILRTLENPSKQAPLPDPPKEATFRHVIPYLIKLAVEEKGMIWRLAAAFVCLFGSKAFGLLCPLMFKRAVDSFTQHAAAPATVIVQHAAQFLLLYGLCDILKHAFKELQSPLFSPLSQAAARRVAYHTFAHVLNLDVKFHLERRTGRLSRILERGTRSIQMLYRAVLFTFAPTALELVFVCGVLAKAFSPVVGLLVVATFTAYVGWSVVMTQIATDARKHVNELDNATSAKAVDALLSYETVTLFNNQALEVGQYNMYLKQYMHASVTTDRLASLLNAGQAFVLAIGLTGIMVTALHTSGPSVSAGDMVMIQGLLLQLWAPLQYLGWFYRELRSALVDMEDFFNILRTYPNIKDGTKPLPPTPLLAANSNGGSASATAKQNGSNGNGTSSTLHPSTALTNGKHSTPSGHSIGAASTVPLGHVVSSGHDMPQQAHMDASAADIAASSDHTQLSTPTLGAGLQVELQDVHFGYTADRKILKGVSLQLEPGRSMALVGTSGSGKSTVLRLLTRLYDVTGGSVRLNGCDVKDLTLESLRSAVAVVPQETTLFNDTILQNIRYGRPTASDEEVIRAARMAHLDKAVERMPLGYQTMVGERGLKLSGGEKQRVAIARAFLHQPRLLICDEATSALDTETEKQIMASLDELARGRTSLFVAHRLSTVMNCDTIVVLKDGQVMEQGSHDELMSRPGGLYRRMWELQAREDSEAQKNGEKRQKQEQLSEVTEPGNESGSDSGSEEGQAAQVIMSVASG